jgi:hypothetical protein
MGAGHFGVTFFVCVLGGAGRGNDGGIYDGASAQLQPIREQQRSYLSKDCGSKFVFRKRLANPP